MYFLKRCTVRFLLQSLYHAKQSGDKLIFNIFSTFFTAMYRNFHTRLMNLLRPVPIGHSIIIRSVSEHFLINLFTLDCT